MPMTYERALKALADDAAKSHVRWQESLRIQRERGEEPRGGAYFYYAFAAKRALIIALTGVYEEGVDPGLEAIRKAEKMMQDSFHWRGEK